MTFFEGIIIFNLVMLLYAVYQIGRLRSEIETVYEGLAVVMTDHEKLRQQTNL